MAIVSGRKLRETIVRGLIGGVANARKENGTGEWATHDYKDQFWRAHAIVSK